MPETISIVMPMFNAERFIGTAIDSCLAQDHEEWELIVVDDASTDASAEIVRSFEDSRIKLLRLPINRGEGHARDTAIGAAGSTWITVLDADDVYLPNRLSELLLVAQSHPETTIILDRVVRWDDGQESLQEARFRASQSSFETQIQSIAGWIRSGHVGKPFFSRRLIADKRIQHPDTKMGADVVFLVRLAQHSGASIVQCTRAGYLWRDVDGSMSSPSHEHSLEACRSFGMLLDEFSSDPDLSAALRDEFRSMRTQSELLLLRDHLRSRSPLSAVRTAATSPGLIALLARQAPHYMQTWRDFPRRLGFKGFT